MLTDERNNLKNNLGHITKPEAINEVKVYLLLENYLIQLMYLSFDL